MKTQIISLESHDDLISVRDRMAWAKTPRTLLVWPLHENISLRPLDLKVLQRQARFLGSQLGLVTRKRNIRREAQALGIPVFSSTGEAQRKAWPEPIPADRRRRRQPRQDLRELRRQVRGPERTWRDLLAVRISFFALGVIAVLALVSLFVPRATITLIPEARVQQVTLPVQADPNVKTVFITGNLPAREIKLVVNGSQEMETSGELPQPFTEARGVVTFSNLTDEAVELPNGTVISTVSSDGPVQFQTIEAGELPAGIGETLDLPVQGMDAGAAGNVQAGTLRIVKGEIGLNVTASNEEPFTGGRNRIVSAASDVDREKLHQQLLHELRQKFLENVNETLLPEDELFPDTVEIDQIIDETYTPPPGQPGQTVRLSLQVEFSARYAAASDLGELASTVLNASIPAGFMASGDGLSFEPVGQLSTDAGGVTRWQVGVARKLVRQINPALATQLSLGRSPRAATTRIHERIPLAEPPKISLNPPWWPWLPLMPFRITVETQ